MTLSEFTYTVLLKPKPLRLLVNRILCFFIPRTKRIGEAIVALNPSDPVVSGALTLGVYERDEIQFFRKSYVPGMSFLDIGANSGLYTALAISQGHPLGKMLAVEPHEESRKYLIETIRLNNGETVAVEGVAVGSNQGVATLFSNPDNKGDNRTYNDPLLSLSSTVPVETIDRLCEKHRIESIDFIKIDIQGSEYSALLGAKAVLTRSKACILMTEFWAFGLRRAGADPEDYLDLIRSLGFTISKLKKGSLLKINDDELLEKTSSRHYVNLVAWKGLELMSQ